MRIVIAGDEVAKIFFRLLQDIHPDWETTTVGNVAHQHFIAELPALQVDGVLIADDV